MQFSNYTDFRTWVLKMIDGDDANTGSLAQDTLDLLIAMGESRVYQGTAQIGGLRASSMQTALTGAVAANAVPLPTDCLSLEIVWFDPEKPLEAVSESDLRDRSRWNRGGDVRQYAQSGDTLIFAPEAVNGAEIGGRYYQRPDDIADGLHATFNRYPEVYLFGALAESAPFLGDDSRLPMWEMLFGKWLMRANETERNRAYSGSRLVQKAR